MPEPDLAPMTDDAARRYDLDALRAFAMLLGVVLHSALSFVEGPWIVRDGSQSGLLDAGVSFVHGFRMPLFFLLSGYFTAMLWRRRGTWGLLRHRGARIGVPLAVGCVTVVPMMWAVIFAVTPDGAGEHAGEPREIEPAAAVRGGDIWTAAASGDVESVRRFIDNGAAIDAADPKHRHTPLAWATIGGHGAAVEHLLDAGAAPSGRYGDAHTPLHAAAFFGREEAARLLLARGAEVDAVNGPGETPLDAAGHDRGTTEMIAALLGMPIDFEEVREGRQSVRMMLTEAGARPAAEVAGPDIKQESPAARAAEIAGFLIQIPVFHHLWFLWFLCWLVPGFVIVASLARALPRLPLPTTLISTPLCLLWLVPLTMWPQSMMNAGGQSPGFGPDTSIGLIPMPHVLAYYAIFFGFGATLHAVSGGVDRVARAWTLTLPAGLVLFVPAAGFAVQQPWAAGLIADEDGRRMLGFAGQALFAWLMIFGLLGAFRAFLASERAWVRYLSDASYWLYVTHLPVVLIGQAAFRGVDLPPFVECFAIAGMTTAALLFVYQGGVRYTVVGAMMNGTRTRPAPPSEAEHGLTV